MSISHRKSKFSQLLQKERKRRADILSNIQKLQELIDHITISLDITLFESILNYVLP